MKYRSVANLNSNIKQWIPELPDDLDLIVGIPRSGLLVALLLGLHVNLPITDVEGLCEERILQAGRLGSRAIADLSNERKVLVVDDSVDTGNQMKRTRSRLERAELPHKLLYAAVYVSSRGRGLVDFWCEVVEPPRIFEWNMMHHGYLPVCCVDIDGVLCRDPTPLENDDGDRYKDFITNVKPLVIPTRKIGWLVTCRLEKYRGLTEAWLTKYGIEYSRLVMMDFPDMKTRLASGSHASFKAEIYKSAHAQLFIESSHQQAQKIARLVGRPVFCTEVGRML